MTDSAVKVLHVIHSLSGGGAETQLCHLIAFQREPVQHWVACVNPVNPALPLDSRHIVPLGVSAKNPRMFFAILRAVQDLQPDIVHVWLPPSLTIPAMVAGALQGKKIVFSYRNQMGFHRLLNYPEWLLACVLAHAVASNSASNARHSRLYSALFRRKRGVVVHNCVRVSAGLQWSGAGVQESSEPLKILFAGRIVEQKNLQVLLHALARIGSAANVQLSVLGEGDQMALMQEMAQALGVAEKVSFAGFCRDIHLRMQQSDLLVFPSLYEGMPNVLVEAMAIGLPCLFSDIPAHRELVSGYDELAWFSPDDADGLANRIKILAHDRQRLSAFSVNGRTIARRFSVDSLIDGYEKFYRDVVSCSSEIREESQP